MFEAVILQTFGILLFVGCPFLILYMLLKTRDKASSTMMPEKKKRISSYRFYWNNPRLISELSREQRQRVEEKFFKLVERSRKQNAKRISRTAM